MNIQYQVSSNFSGAQIPDQWTQRSLEQWTHELMGIFQHLKDIQTAIQSLENFNMNVYNEFQSFSVEAVKAEYEAKRLELVAMAQEIEGRATLICSSLSSRFDSIESRFLTLEHRIEQIYSGMLKAQ